MVDAPTQLHRSPSANNRWQWTVREHPASLLLPAAARRTEESPGDLSSPAHGLIGHGWVTRTSH